MALASHIRIGAGCLKPELEPATLFLTVPDVRGTYTLPYIQSARDLNASVDLPPAVAEVALTLRPAGGRAIRASARPGRETVRFPNLAPGEYTLEAVARRAGRKELGRSTLRRIGIGTVIAALGDSITEGYYSAGYMRGDGLHAGLFPPEAVSRDGRSFPQYSPTTHQHLPSVNCFESWMTDLNDALSEAWGHPVFIANEGWGGYTTTDYLRMVRTDRGWQERMRLLRPQVWLIHLGVNDERAHTPAEGVAANLDALVQELIETYGATPGRILVARPSYDYAPGAEEYLLAYCDRIDALIRRRRLAPGPDFHAAYATEKERWYGQDPVHPNPEGMRRMAGLWAQAILRAEGAHRRTQRRGGEGDGIGSPSAPSFSSAPLR